VNGKAEQHFCVVAVVKLINPAQDGKGTLHLIRGLEACPLAFNRGRHCT